MNSSADTFIVIYVNGYVILSADKGVTFFYSQPLRFLIPQIMLFEEINVGFCKGINVSTQKRGVRIKYNSPMIVSRNIKYRSIKISSDKDIRVMFRMYWQYKPHISAIELYVDLEEAVVTQTDPNSYLAS